MPQFVITDAGKLRQILINLIGNAIKFTARGEVSLTVTQETARQLSSPAQPSKIRFQVKDTGIGIAKENLEKIFLPFGGMDKSH